VAHKKGFFVTGIGTGVGKTVVSAIIAEATGYDYWKPVQAGELDNSDSITVTQLLGPSHSRVLPERFRLKTAASPHLAASREKISIEISDFSIPETERGIIIEGAGGLMVPLNNKNTTMLDLINFFGLPVVVVVRNYLGAINHSLLTLNQLKSADVETTGVVLNGNFEPEVKEAILSFSGARELLEIHDEKFWDIKTVKKYAEKWNNANRQAG